MDSYWKGFFAQKANISNKNTPTAADFQAIAQIKEIDCSGADVKTLSPLSALQNLEVLWCDQNETINDLSALSDLPKLRKIECSETRISSLEPLRNIKTLESLECRKTNITNLGPLAGLRKLRVLDITDTKVSSLYPIKYVTSLEVLYMARTKVAALDPLKDLTGLTELTFSETKVSSLAPLSKLSKLRELVLAKTAVSKITPIKSKNLMILYAEDTPLDSKDVATFKKNYPDCEVFYSGI